LLTLALALALSLPSCVSEEAQRREVVGEILGLSLSGGEELFYEDTHGGFHGDGGTWAVYAFAPDNSPAEEIPEKAQGWHPLPAGGSVEKVLYGQYGLPAPEGYGEETFFPQAAEGWYFFLDRHSEAEDCWAEEGFLERYSQNYTLAVYDTADERLYYFKLDT